MSRWFGGLLWCLFLCGVMFIVAFANDRRLGVPAPYGLLVAPLVALLPGILLWRFRGVSRQRRRAEPVSRLFSVVLLRPAALGAERGASPVEPLAADGPLPSGLGEGVRS